MRGYEAGTWASRAARIADSASRWGAFSSSSIYDLRHSFASLLRHEGRSVVHVARQLGHGTGLTTGTYGHVRSNSANSNSRAGSPPANATCAASSRRSSTLHNYAAKPPIPAGDLNARYTAVSVHLTFQRHVFGSGAIALVTVLIGLASAPASLASRIVGDYPRADGQDGYCLVPCAATFRSDDGMPYDWELIFRTWGGSDVIVATATNAPSITYTAPTEQGGALFGGARFLYPRVTNSNVEPIAGFGRPVENYVYLVTADSSPSQVMVTPTDLNLPALIGIRSPDPGLTVSADSFYSSERSDLFSFDLGVPLPQQPCSSGMPVGTRCFLLERAARTGSVRVSVRFPTPGGGGATQPFRLNVLSNRGAYEHASPVGLFIGRFSGKRRCTVWAPIRVFAWSTGVVTKETYVLEKRIGKRWVRVWKKAVPDDPVPEPQYALPGEGVLTGEPLVLTPKPGRGKYRISAKVKVVDPNGVAFQTTLAKRVKMRSACNKNVNFSF